MTKNNQGTDRRPHATTRLARTVIQDLCHRIHKKLNGDLPAAGSRRLGLYQSIRLVPASLRHNLEQQLLAELFDISQPTVSRVLTAWTPLVADTLADNIPTTDDLDPDTQLIIDGTPALCWAWRDKPELYSGKHHTTGVNLQVACTLTGALAWVSDPLPGHTHDARALAESGLLDIEDDDPDRSPHPRHIADKGYTGLDLITPTKKPAGLPQTEANKIYNRAIGKIRWRIEQTIAHLKNWHALKTRYRRPINTFPDTITAILGIMFTYTL